MGVEPGMVAVDLCCGDGLFTVPMARIAMRVYAIDIDRAMLDRARAHLAAAGAANCEFFVAMRCPQNSNSRPSATVLKTTYFVEF